MPKLKNWGVVSLMDEYQAPELSAARLKGNVYGDGRFLEGEEIVTSPIACADGRNITTRTGTVYYLEGAPDPAYLSYTSKCGHQYDPEKPIKIEKGWN